jgi:hypothetical protein
MIKDFMVKLKMHKLPEEIVSAFNKFVNSSNLSVDEKDALNKLIENTYDAGFFDGADDALYDIHSRY